MAEFRDVRITKQEGELINLALHQIQRKVDQGKAVILMEQNVSMIETLAHRVVMLGSDGVEFQLEGADITRQALLEGLRV